MRLIQLGMLSLVVVVACSDDTKPSANNCAHDRIEADLDADKFVGPGAGEDGKLNLAPGSYVVSSTYGQPYPGPDGAPVTQHYVDVFAGIQTQLEQQQGLLAFTLASSDACGSGRTLAVWRSEDEMYDFVTSPAHLAAMSDVKQLLKPTYAVTHWTADAKEITWAAAARELSKVEAH